MRPWMPAGRILAVGVAMLCACDEPIIIEAATDATTEEPATEPAPTPVVTPEPSAIPPTPETIEPPPPTATEIALERAARERATFEARYPLHGVTFHFLARVRSQPRNDAKVIGYLRRGATFRASPRVPGVRCARGWHEIPGGGFVCRGEGFLIGTEPQAFEPSPRPPALQSALPYTYAYSPSNRVPQFWRLPTVEEEADVADVLRRIGQLQEQADEEAERTAAAQPDAAAEQSPAPAANPASPATNPVSPTDATNAAEPDAVEAPPPPGSTAATTDGDEDPVVVEAVENVEAVAEQTSTELVGSPPATGAFTPTAALEPEPTVPDFVRMAMRRGFYVSLDREERDARRRFYRTIRGAYVRADRLTPNEPPSHRGVVVGGSWQLPHSIRIPWAHAQAPQCGYTASRDGAAIAPYTTSRRLDRAPRTTRLRRKSTRRFRPPLKRSGR